jgi:hypothetical protein
MWLLDFLQNLPLGAMFTCALAVGLVICWALLVAVRLAVRAAGIDPATPLPIRDTIIGAVSAVFALMMAFSAAGIWNDTLQASTAVQREANALENVLALAGSLPADLADRVREDVRRYGKEVVERDWPAMTRRSGVNNSDYDISDKLLVDLINVVSREQTRITTLPTLLGQIIEARSARLARLTLANAGVSVVQWLAMLILALAALATVAICNSHHFGMQAIAMHLYTVAAVAAFFVILAHDRPFVGVISVSPAPIVQLSTGK